MLTINMLFKILLSRGGFFVQVEKNEYGEILLDYERNESYVKKNQMEFLVKKKKYLKWKILWMVYIQGTLNCFLKASNIDIILKAEREKYILHTGEQK